MGESASRGLEPARVAEVLVERTATRPGRRGSGYRVPQAYVLTAAHVVADPSASVRVRFEADLPGEWSAEARVVVLAEAADLALLELTPVPPGLPPAEPPRYAVLPDADVTLPFSAVGFPRFKLRRDPGPGQALYRDSCHVSGRISVLSNRREGTLELAVPPPSQDVEPERSPWEGMSGAAVWCEGALVGVVSTHHRADGLGRLAARRVEHWYTTLPTADLERLHDHAGLPRRPEAGLAQGAETEQPAPSLAALPVDLPLRELGALVDALTALPILRNGNGTELLLDSISAEIAANRPRDPRLRMEVYGIVRTCLRYPGTLDQLLEAVRLLEGASVEAERVDQAAKGLARRYS
jgi:hypothetical protein